jgi:hypothetical protein
MLRSQLRIETSTTLISEPKCSSVWFSRQWRKNGWELSLFFLNKHGTLTSMNLMYLAAEIQIVHVQETTVSLHPHIRDRTPHFIGISVIIFLSYKV